MTGRPPMAKIPFVNLPHALAGDRTALLGAFQRVLDSGRFVLGAELEQFESEFAALAGAAHAVGVGNGLDALYLSLLALGVGAGDEVVVPAHTFIATWLAIARCGATPVPVEPDEDTFLVTADGIASAMGPRTRAVIAVHLYGSTQGIDRIAALCRGKGVPLIEDAAQAHGARCADRQAGTHGTAGCFSFYPTKNLGAFGDAGAVVTDDARLADSVRVLRNYGSRQKYRHDEAGINSRLDEVQAALLRVRLRHLPEENLRRQQLAARYLEGLAGLDSVQLPQPGPRGSHVWHLFVVRSPRRDELQRFLAARGIETHIHYPLPVYRQPPFATFAPPEPSVSDRISSSVLSLPLGMHLQTSDVDIVCEAVRAFTRQ